MAYGVTDAGFVIKRLEDVKLEKETSLKAAFGNGINLQPESVLGQEVGINAEREALLWELGQALYDAMYPETASGVSLDWVVSLTGIERLAATYSTGSVNAKGTLATVIPIASVISVSGNSDLTFETVAAGTIGAGTDEIQDITFSFVPDAGSFTLIFDGEETGVIAWNAAAIAVQNALNALSVLSAVTVAGTFAAGFTVTFAGADGSQPQVAILEGNTNSLEIVGTPITISVAETTAGLLPNIDIEVIAQTPGAVAALSGSLTVIETIVVGWDSVSNPLDIDTGNDIETDAALRIRRMQTLAAPGSATVDGIRAEILDIDDVTAALVYENDTMVVDGAGRPAKSIECVVLDGVDADIAEAIWDTKAAGIQTYGSSSEVITDSQDFDHTIYFSRPTPITIWLEVDIVVNSTFPTGGETSIKTNVVAFAENTTTGFSIGDDVIVTELYEAVHEVIGIDDIDFRIAVANIALVQTLTMDADFVALNTIDLDVAGVAIAQVPFNATHNQTMTDLATAIQALATVATASVTAAREITVTAAAAGTPTPMSNYVCASGLSQPDAEIDTTSHDDANIAVAVNEISTWDTSRIIVTNIT